MAKSYVSFRGGHRHNASLADRLGVSLKPCAVMSSCSRGTFHPQDARRRGLPSMAGEAPSSGACARTPMPSGRSRAWSPLPSATAIDHARHRHHHLFPCTRTARPWRLIVVTKPSDIVCTLATVNGNKVYMAGGELRSDPGVLRGLCNESSAVSRRPRGDFHRRGRCGHRRHGLRSEEAEFARMVRHAASVRSSLPITAPGSPGWCRLAARTGLRNSPPIGRRRATSQPPSGRPARGWLSRLGKAGHNQPRSLVCQAGVETVAGGNVILKQALAILPSNTSTRPP